ncbi:hypothetical protein Unana1_07770 [Umbelopsis nana]
MNDNAMWLRVANTFKLPEVCQGMSFAQGALPYGLLIAGIRHFDFRVYWDGTDYYGHHGYVGYKLEVYMNSIKAFITCHAPKNEIISITIQGNESITKAKKEVEFAAWFYNFFPTGTVLPATFDENDIPILPPQTVAELAKDRNDVMDKDADGTKFYPSSLLKDNFRDSCDSLELLSGILPQYKDDITATARPKQMVQIQWVIGPQATGIIKQVINIVGIASIIRDALCPAAFFSFIALMGCLDNLSMKWHSLKGKGHTILHAYTGDAVRQQLASTMQAYLGPFLQRVNIILADDVEQTGLVELAIKMNKTEPFVPPST